MAQSLANILVHAIFSTKLREPCLTAELRRELYAYMAAVLKNMDCIPLQIGGAADHLHVLCTMSKSLSIASLIEGVKSPTSRWLKSRGAMFGKFQWQNGYGAFSVSPSNKERVCHYIANQEQHHRKMTFEEEFREFLLKHGVAYDERYVWD